MSKSVVVEITPDGQVSVHIEGVPGPTCVPLARRVAELLGTAEDEEHTDEFWLLEGLSPVEAARRIGRGLNEGWIAPDEARALMERAELSVEDLTAVLSGEGGELEGPPAAVEVERASGDRSS